VTQIRSPLSSSLNDRQAAVFIANFSVLDPNGNEPLDHVMRSFFDLSSASYSSPRAGVFQNTSFRQKRRAPYFRDQTNPW
jgi:hypothetical protein